MSIKRTANRRGEDCGIPSRRSRLYSVDGQWYFRVREANDQGPYESYTKAKNDLVMFLRRSGIVKIAV